jgi:hypothetical protein
LISTPGLTLAVAGFFLGKGLRTTIGHSQLISESDQFRFGMRQPTGHAPIRAAPKSLIGIPKTKNGHARTIPLSYDAIAVLTAFERSTDRVLRRDVNRLTPRSGDNYSDWLRGVDPVIDQQGENVRETISSVSDSNEGCHRNHMFVVSGRIPRCLFD